MIALIDIIFKLCFVFLLSTLIRWNGIRCKCELISNDGYNKSAREPLKNGLIGNSKNIFSTTSEYDLITEKEISRILSPISTPISSSSSYENSHEDDIFKKVFKNETEGKIHKSNNSTTDGKATRQIKSRNFDDAVANFDSSDEIRISSDDSSNFEPSNKIKYESDNNIKLTNIVKRPHGFTTSVAPPFDSGTRRTVNASRISIRRRTTEIPSTGTPPISKNEISRKTKPSPSFPNRRKIQGVNFEEALPTGSDVWALASMKGPNGTKPFKRNNGGFRRNSSTPSMKGSPLSTTIKPFIPWSTRLQKPYFRESTTELYATTTFMDDINETEENTLRETTYMNNVYENNNNNKNNDKLELINTNYDYHNKKDNDVNVTSNIENTYQKNTIIQHNSKNNNEENNSWNNKEETIEKLKDKNTTTAGNPNTNEAAKQLLISKENNNNIEAKTIEKLIKNTMLENKKEIVNEDEKMDNKKEIDKKIKEQNNIDNLKDKKESNTKNIEENEEKVEEQNRKEIMKNSAENDKKIVEISEKPNDKKILKVFTEINVKSEELNDTKILESAVTNQGAVKSTEEPNHEEIFKGTVEVAHQETVKHAEQPDNKEILKETVQLNHQETVNVEEPVHEGALRGVVEINYGKTDKGNQREIVDNSEEREKIMNDVSEHISKEPVKDKEEDKEISILKGTVGDYPKTNEPQNFIEMKKDSAERVPNQDQGEQLKATLGDNPKITLKTNESQNFIETLKDSAGREPNQGEPLKGTLGDNPKITLKTNESQNSIETLKDSVEKEPNHEVPLAGTTGNNPKASLKTNEPLNYIELTNYSAEEKKPNGGAPNEPPNYKELVKDSLENKSKDLSEDHNIDKSHSENKEMLITHDNETLSFSTTNKDQINKENSENIKERKIELNNVKEANNNNIEKYNTDINKGDKISSDLKNKIEHYENANNKTKNNEKIQEIENNKEKITNENSEEVQKINENLTKIDNMKSSSTEKYQEMERENKINSTNKEENISENKIMKINNEFLLNSEMKKGDNKIENKNQTDKPNILNYNGTEVSNIWEPTQEVKMTKLNKGLDVEDNTVSSIKIPNKQKDKYKHLHNKTCDEGYMDEDCDKIDLTDQKIKSNSTLWSLKIFYDDEYSSNETEDKYTTEKTQNFTDSYEKQDLTSNDTPIIITDVTSSTSFVPADSSATQDLSSKTPDRPAGGLTITTDATKIVETTIGSEITTFNVVSSTFHPDTTFKPAELPSANVPAYLMLLFKSSFADICRTSSLLKESLYQLIARRSFSDRVQSRDQIVVFIDTKQCEEPDYSPRIIPVGLYLVDGLGTYDPSLVSELKAVLQADQLDYISPIHEIIYHENLLPDNSRLIVASIITVVAAICFILLIFLLCMVSKRQRLNYGQRCAPATVDDYNLDNISVCSSVRRKSIRSASKHSYGNAAFDDPAAISKSLNYAGLLKACENRSMLDEEFLRIPVVTVKAEELPPGMEYKNRYANVIPLPETRVSLPPPGQDYINANYVKGHKGVDKFYIACQAPMRSTIEDFWKMIWNEQSTVIIMLTALKENAIEKCVDYLPPSEVLDCHRMFGDYQITLKKREVREKYVISSLQLKNLESNLWREVTHLWYTNWPAQGVPSEQSSIIALLIEARCYMRSSRGPNIVHCSPGTGRTGTVIACDIAIRDYEQMRCVDIPMIVSKLRRCRAGAVQTRDQYAFIYKVLSLYAKKLNGNSFVDSI